MLNSLQLASFKTECFYSNLNSSLVARSTKADVGNPFISQQTYPILFLFISVCGTEGLIYKIMDLF